MFAMGREMELRDVSVTSQFERQHTIGLRIEWRRLTSDDAPSLSLAAYKTTTKRLGNEETNESTNRHNILSILRDVVFVPRVRRTKQNCSSSFLFSYLCWQTQFAQSTIKTFVNLIFSPKTNIPTISSPFRNKC